MTRALCDMHVHTKHSCDARAELESYCVRAMELGVHALCFTDHVDNNPNDSGLGFYDSEAFFGDFARVKKKYGRWLALLCGIEFAEPHLYPQELARLSAMPYDFILGSNHFWYQGLFPSLMVKQGIPAEVCYEHYWDTILSTVQAGGFDSLAHIDFPKRYYGQLLIDRDKLHSICKAMVRNHICMEINTSTLRKGMDETMPGPDILSVYKSCGGKYVTVGSDAHEPEDLAAGNAQARELIARFGFEERIFIQRLPHRLPYK